MEPAAPRQAYVEDKQRPEYTGGQAARSSHHTNPPRGEVVDLTSPIRHGHTELANMNHHESSAYPLQGNNIQRYPPVPSMNGPNGSALHGRPAVLPLDRNASSQYAYPTFSQGPMPYDPTQPLVQSQNPQPIARTDHTPTQSQQGFSTVPEAQDSIQFQAQYRDSQTRQPSTRGPGPIAPYRVVYAPQPRASPLTPQPVHGAPAPVQQLPRGVVHTGPALQLYEYPSNAPLPPQYPRRPPPVNGSVAPTQYYRPR